MNFIFLSFSKVSVIWLTNFQSKKIKNKKLDIDPKWISSTDGNHVITNCWICSQIKFTRRDHCNTGNRLLCSSSLLPWQLRGLALPEMQYTSKIYQIYLPNAFKHSLCKRLIVNRPVLPGRYVPYSSDKAEKDDKNKVRHTFNLASRQ